MHTVGIICAIERELEPFLKALRAGQTRSVAMLTCHEGTIEDVNVVALYCGVCKVNAAIAAQILVDRYKVDAVVVSGTAGGIDERLAIGDSVIATEVCYHDVAGDILTEYHPWMPNDFFSSDPTLLALCRENITAHNKAKIYYGRIATGEAFIDEDGRAAIIKAVNPLCVDMETAAVAHVCYVNHTPFIAVRSISDTEAEHGESVFDENCNHAAGQSYHIVRQLLTQIRKNG